MAASEPKTVLEFLNLAAEFFGKRDIENPRLNAELLLCGVAGLKRIDLYVQFDRPLTKQEVDRYRDHLRRRAAGEPVQYILGATEFYGREFRVTPAVLIPRPETEILVEESLKRLAGIGSPSVLDIGAGSGAIALTVAAELPESTVVATDISSDALAVARDNAERLGVSSRTVFRESDVYETLPPDTAPFDAILSNPPYIRTDERADLQTEVVDHEPGTALFAGDDGLEVIRRIVSGCASHLRDGGFCAMEVGKGQADAVRDLWIEDSPEWNVSVVKDLAGIDRIVIADHRVITERS